LTNSSLTFGGSSAVINFNSIQKAVLDGTSSGNTFDVTGWTNGNVTVNGMGGNNTIIATGSGTITLTNTSLAFTNDPGVTITLSSIQNAVLNGSGSGNTFDVTGWTSGNVAVNGSGGNNAIVAGGSGTITLTNTSITFSGNPAVAITLSSIQNAVINGSSGGNTFDVMSWQQGGNVTFNGNPSSGGNANIYIFNPFPPSATVNAFVNGGGSNNTVDISSFSSGTTVNVSVTGQQMIASYLFLTLTGVQFADQGSGAAAHVVSLPGAQSLQGPALTNALRDISGGAIALDGSATATPQDLGDSLVTSVTTEDGPATSGPEENRDAHLGMDSREADNQFLQQTRASIVAGDKDGFASLAADKPGDANGIESFGWTNSHDSDPKSSS
jgi:hypothetical protein